MKGLNKAKNGRVVIIMDSLSSWAAILDLRHIFGKRVIRLHAAIGVCQLQVVYVECSAVNNNRYAN